MAKITFLLRSDKPLFHTMPKAARWVIGFALALYACACAILWIQQRSIVFHPMAAGKAAEGSVKATEGAAQFWITKAKPAPAGVASACPLPATPGGSHGAVAYFGGNAERASAFGAKAKELLGCDIYALNYPGYEGAPGSPSEDSIHQAADAMMARMARDGVDFSRSLFIGRSLGSGEAARQASLGPCHMAILATPYDSLSSVALDYAPWAPVSLLIRDPFPASSWGSKALCPALILYAESDDTINPSHAQNLSKAWNPDKGSRMATVDGVTHANFMEVPALWTLIRATLAQYLQQQAQYKSQKP
jgi:pimeloyl-ACP methyl ester carboxylesterase